MVEINGGVMKTYGADLAQVFNETWDGAYPWRTLERLLVRRLKGGGAWLDFACGTGDLLARAEGIGFECTGVDVSAHQLRIARAALPDARFVRGPMQSARLKRRFDVITCFGGSIHHLQSARELRQFLANAHRHLGPDGVFVFECNTFVRRPDIENSYTGGVWTYRLPGRFVTVEFDYDEDARRSTWTTTGFEKQGRLYRKFEETYILRAHPIDEVDETLDSLGFQFRKYDPHTKSMRPRKKSIEYYYVCSV